MKFKNRKFAMWNYQALLIVMVIVLFSSVSGCATYTTISKATPGSPKIYSGTRLDIHAIAKDKLRLRIYKKKYDVDPPEYPLIKPVQ